MSTPRQWMSELALETALRELDEALEALRNVTDEKAERLAEDMDDRNKDHSGWYRNVQRARRLLAKHPKVKP